MAESTLQERLKDHAKAFDGLLSLIPAKYYYGEDTSDQWSKKKQTKEQAAAAKRAKLDPDSIKSAKDVMDERARKRKAEEMDEMSDVEGVERELPKQGLKEKKQKTEAQATKSSITSANNTDPAQDVEAAKKAKAERKKVKQQLKKEQAAKKVAKSKAKKQAASAKDEQITQDSDRITVELDGIASDSLSNTQPQSSTQVADVTNPETEANDIVEQIEVNGLQDGDQESQSSIDSPAQTGSPLFDPPNEPSANTSTSSTIPPATAPKHIKMPTDPELLRSRLAARIEALRAARKADGLNGAPARNRQELMEARRKKEEQRRAHKKELRKQARIEEDAEREEALASARDSPMSPAIHSGSENSFSFGRVAFADGQQLADNLSGLLSAPKKKGPQDAATALQAQEKKRSRLAGFDEEKRADIEEKDVWLTARKRAHGERVRDDTNLLKKTLKRKEKSKKKSEKEWNDRKEGVAKSQAMRQKKREDNLQKRKDEKGGKGKGKAAKKGGKPKPKSRPGFEGSFSGGGKKR